MQLIVARDCDIRGLTCIREVWNENYQMSPSLCACVCVCLCMKVCVRPIACAKFTVKTEISKYMAAIPPAVLQLLAGKKGEYDYHN